MDGTTIVAGLGVLYLVYLVMRSRGKASRLRAYQAALAELAASPADVSLRVSALNAGRAHYGGLRKGGAPTIYDEQAINNDITAHAGR